MRIPQRLFGLVIAVLSAAGVYYVWRETQVKNEYHPKLAVFAPLCAVGGVFLLLFPQYFGAPETTKEKIIVFTVFGIGVILGLINWYLIDPGFFQF